MGIHWEAVQERWCRERLVTGETEKEREAAYGKSPSKLRRTVERERVCISTSDVRETGSTKEREYVKKRCGVRDAVFSH